MKQKPVTITDVPRVAQQTRIALGSLDKIPRQNDEPVFSEPWQAEVFAMTLLLHERGLFSWPQWADQLSMTIQKAQKAGDPDDGSTYYLHWLSALEALLVRQNIADQDELHTLFEAWDAAATATPHGEPIMLKR